MKQDYVTKRLVTPGRLVRPVIMELTRLRPKVVEFLMAMILGMMHERCKI